MKSISNKLLLTGIAGIISISSFGQLTFDGEYRPRAEYRHGYKVDADTNQASAFHISQRARLNVGYKVDDYEFYISVQDVRVWGANPQLNVSDGFLSVHQAWGKINFNKNLGLKLGRQEIILDDHRIFGNVGWTQQARSHDAAVIQYEKGKMKLHVGLAFNQTANKLGALSGVDYMLAKSYRDMHYAWFNYKVSDKITTSLLFLNLGNQSFDTLASGVQNDAMYYTQTLGTHTKFNFGKLKMVFNGFYQMGSPQKTLTKHQDKLSAYLIGLEANYAVTEKFKLGLGFEMQSGQSQTDTTSSYVKTNHAFTPFFGTNHKFNGLMDYFYVGSGHQNVGLNDAYLKIGYKLKKVTLGLNTHVFLAGNEVMDQVEFANSGEYKAMSSFLGTEFDFSIGFKINPSVSVKMGYSHMLASETLATLKGVTYTSGPDLGKGRTDQINNWAYTMIVIKPNFLKKKD